MPGNRLARRVALACHLACALALAGGAGAAWAENPGALQAAGLFEKACLNYAGEPQGLRAWADGARLTRLHAEQTWAASGGRPAVAFGVATPDGRMVLVSQDNGTCRIVIQHQLPAEVESATLRLLSRLGVTTALITERQSAGASSRERVFIADLGIRRLYLFVQAARDPARPDEWPVVALELRQGFP